MRFHHGFLAAFSVLVTAAGASGCGDSNDQPADVAGDYTIAVTNRDNGCGFTNFTPGESAPGIPLTMIQNGSDVTGTLGGAAGVIFTLGLGSNELTGSVSGNSITMTRHGTTPATDSGCTYTLNATITATADGDILQGQIDYTYVGDTTNPACDGILGCHTYQDFNGTRPPQ